MVLADRTTVLEDGYEAEAVEVHHRELLVVTSLALLHEVIVLTTVIRGTGANEAKLVLREFRKPGSGEAELFHHLGGELSEAVLFAGGGRVHCI